MNPDKLTLVNSTLKIKQDSSLVGREKAEKAKSEKLTDENKTLLQKMIEQGEKDVSIKKRLI